MFTHPRVIQDVEEFVYSSDLEKCNITSLAQQWMLCSEWVPSEWVQTADKNITKNPQVIQKHNSSPSVNVLWSNNLHV